MIKKSSRFFASLIVITLVVLCFQACSSNKKGDNYITAKVINTFSVSGDIMCLTDGGGFFIEKDGVVKSQYDYDMGTGDQHFSDPFLDGDYLYYVGG